MTEFAPLSICAVVLGCLLVLVSVVHHCMVVGVFFGYLLVSVAFSIDSLLSGVCVIRILLHGES